MQESFQKETQDDSWGSTLVEVEYQKQQSEEGSITHAITVQSESLQMVREFTDIIVCKGILCYLFEQPSIAASELKMLEFEQKIAP